MLWHCPPSLEGWGLPQPRILRDKYCGGGGFFMPPAGYPALRDSFQSLLLYLGCFAPKPLTRLFPQLSWKSRGKRALYLACQFQQVMFSISYKSIEYEAYSHRLVRHRMNKYLQTGLNSLQVKLHEPYLWSWKIFGWRLFCWIRSWAEFSDKWKIFGWYLCLLMDKYSQTDLNSLQVKLHEFYVWQIIIKN